MTTMRSSSVSSHVQDLLDATSGSQSNALHELYLSYPDPNTIDEEGQHALIHASKLGHTCVVKILCEQGSNLDLKDLSGTTALIYAVRHGHEKIVKHLCRRLADVNACDNKGRTALHYAAFRGFRRIAQTLLKCGAEVNLQDNTGRSALHIAVARDNATVVEVLLKGGASLSLKDGEKVTARQSAEKRRCSVVQEVMDKYQKEKFSDMNRLGFFFSSKLLGMFKARKNISTADVDTELRTVHCVIENDYFQPTRNREEITVRQKVTGIEVENSEEQGPRGTDVSLTSPHLDDFSIYDAADDRTINPTDQSNREPCKNDLGSPNGKACNNDLSLERSPQPHSQQQTLTRRECEKLAGYETCSFFITKQKLPKEDSPLTPPSTRCNEAVFYPITPTAHQFQREAGEEENARVTRLQLQSFTPTTTSTPVQNKRLNPDNTTNNNNLHLKPLLTPRISAKGLVDPSKVSTTHRNISHSTWVSFVEPPESTADAHGAILQRNGDVYFTPPPLPPKLSKKRGNLDAIFAINQLPHSQREGLNPPLLVMNSTSPRSLTTLQLLPPETERDSRYQLHPEQQQILNFTRKQDCEETQKDVADELHCCQTPIYAKAEMLSPSSVSSDNLVFRTSHSLLSKPSPGSNTDNVCSFMTYTLPLPKKRATRPGCPQITRLTPSKRRARLNRMKDISQNYQKDQENNHHKDTLSQSPHPLDEIINHQQKNMGLCRNPASLQLLKDKTSFAQSDPVVAPPRLPRRKPGLLVKVPHTNSIGLSSPSPQSTPNILNKSQSPLLTRMYNTNMHVIKRPEQETSQTRFPGLEYYPHVKFSLWPSTETNDQSVLNPVSAGPIQSMSTVSTSGTDVQNALHTYTHSIDDPLSPLNEWKPKRDFANIPNENTQTPKPTDDNKYNPLESVSMRKRPLNNPAEGGEVGHSKNNGRRTYATQLSDSDEYLIHNLKAPQGRDDKTSTFPRNSLAGGSSLSSVGSRDMWISSGQKNLAPEHGLSGEKGILSQDALTLDVFNKDKKAIYQHMKRAISSIDLNQHFSTIKTSRSCPSITQPTEVGAYNISLNLIFKSQLQVNCQELQVAKADFLATNNSQLQVYYNHDNNHHDDNHHDESDNEEFG